MGINRRAGVVKVIRWNGRKLTVGETTLELEYPIEEAFVAGDRVVVLLACSAQAENWRQFPNLIALDRRGNKLWTAELPTTYSVDCYHMIASRDPLVVYSLASYECEIDVTNGRIRKRTFTK